MYIIEKQTNKHNYSLSCECKLSDLHILKLVNIHLVKMEATSDSALQIPCVRFPELIHFPLYNIFFSILLYHYREKLFIKFINSN